MLGPLSDIGRERVVTLMSANRDTTLWLDDHQETLDILAAMPWLRRLQATSLRLRSITAVDNTPDLIEVSMGDTLRPVSLEPLRGRTSLRSLNLRGTWRDVDVLSSLTGLRSLVIGGIDLALLEPLRELGSLDSGLGRITNFELLPSIGVLRDVSLYRVRGLADVTALGAIPSLRHLSLQAMSAISALPSFRDSPELRRIDLETMTSVTDLQPIADAPSLRYLLLIEMPKLDPEALRPLVEHPSLRAGVWGLGSKRKNFAAQDILPLPPEPYGYAEARGLAPAPPLVNPWLADDLSS
ncbi:MAG TPA: hypothetical protein VFY18_05910 [Candidatus Limnocylindrales bacterium]|nr:hypothetical protein [Candidatus Limnocylindrales bacterium]